MAKELDARNHVRRVGGACARAGERHEVVVIDVTSDRLDLRQIRYDFDQDPERFR